MNFQRVVSDTIDNVKAKLLTHDEHLQTRFNCSCSDTIEVVKIQIQDIEGKLHELQVDKIERLEAGLDVLEQSIDKVAAKVGLLPIARKGTGRGRGKYRQGA